ncbi:uncharacterized protein LOC110460656 [Mizuhopecten yessoensis]|uniref:uncharacterized protein LOC110460656 n=1 Tax=Mizuhopecten yessoensis TaxID=6573 RepID=UPI000B45E71C|nr:uncharacterized protein LOC110460656 [Mizuhopecten yessoensis]
MTGWGAYLSGQTSAGVWSGEQLSEHINVLEMRAVLLALRGLRPSLQGKAICLATDNSTVVAYLQRQGGTRSPALCALSTQVLLLCQEISLDLTVRHLPGRLNVLADTLSRSRSPVLTEWTLKRSVFRSLCLVWDRPHVDLFATALNFRLPTFVSPVPDPMAMAVDALSKDWSGMYAYAFPPFNLVGRVLEKILLHHCTVLLVAPLWPRQRWFPLLLRLSVDFPRSIPTLCDLLSQPRSRQFYSGPERLHLHGWMLSREGSLRRAFLEKLQLASQDHLDLRLPPPTNLDGPPSVIGVSDGRLTQSLPLFPL